MAERIARHRADRGEGWATRETPLALVEALGEEARCGRIVVVDCLTLWLSNLMFAGRDVENEVARLVAALPRLRGPTILVSNEVGLGIVPENALARAFRDAQGRANRDVAAACDAVTLVAAGLPTLLKPTTGPRFSIR
jgi:adenosylcobinamide kinase / adenosylcobinamide-phosphate guanylyltransferase